MKRSDITQYIDPEAKWQTDFITQYKTLVKRNFVREKPRYFSTISIGYILFCALITGLVWFRTPRNEETSRDRLGVVSMCCMHIPNTQST